MDFRDRYETDAAGNQFIFTVEMQRRLSDAGLPVEVAYLDQLKEGAPPQNQEPRKEPPKEEPRQEQRSSRKEVTEPESIQIDPMTGKYIIRGGIR